MIPVLMFLFSSIVYAQTDVNKHEKETGTSLIAPSIQDAKDFPKLSSSDTKQIDSSQKREGSNEESKQKPKPKPAQTFTGSGPAMARDNPDA
ncbi:hypothetical protein [Microbulbifer hydrolyticus]|uniref:Uncharacterized protein n=1 Tax=Microbulbifer hydrolyticus TaxID=48074 RepID=A0A6P1TA42_9GAMM|nr:hypothetical protein [Microbulbifer hydrolyticus]MBB5211957.1 hypothetical protein [Microbulbifer hydrolyticus]QHQ39644.1 hypothetical protein GTQ55_12040 [Microbulbifer hydrolyticus]